MDEKRFQGLENIKVDPGSLYREEVFTDLKLATIRKLTPIKADGSEDSDRETLFVGETQLVSSLGPLPLSAKLEGTTLEEAAGAFPKAIKGAAARMVEEINEMRRRESSKIVVPGQDMGGGLPGMPGGGIKLT